MTVRIVTKSVNLFSPVPKPKQGQDKRIDIQNKE